MQLVPRIFVSATSRDLRTARGLVAEGLRRMECLPIVQDDFPPDYKSVRDMLRTKISACNAVVHLAGFYYGAEPQPVLPGPDRRSFTQMEYEIAMELKLPCYVFLCGENFPFDPHDPEPEEKQQLQAAHRARLLQRDELFYEFASPEELSNRTRELQLSVENLRKELAKERGRRRFAMVAALAALFIAVGGGIWMHGRQKKAEAITVQQGSEIAALKAQLEGPTFIVGKVNTAMALVREQGKGSEEEMKAVAINLVATELNKPAEEIKKAIDSAADLCGKLIAAAQAEGKNDPTKLASSRDLEAETLKSLADAHLAAGRINEAVAALQQRLALLDREKDSDTWAQTVEALADQLRARRSYSEALTLRREALEWAKASPKLGPEHPTTLRLMASLADGGVPDHEAQELIRSVLKIRERDLGPEHEETLAAVAILARAAASAKECETLYRRVIEARTKQFGAEHEKTVSPMVLLAKALKYDWQDYAGAGKLFEKVLEIRERKLGPEHNDTATALSLLADLRSDQKDYAASIKLYRRALEVRERNAGPDGADTLIVLNNLAIELHNSEQPGALDEAIALDSRVLETRIRTIGAGQPVTLVSFVNHAVLLEAKGDVDGGRKLRLRALDEQEKAIGPKDTAFLSSLNKAVASFSKKKDFKTALPLAERYLKLREETLPEGAPEILEAMENVANLQDDLGNVAEAVRLTRLSIELRERKQPAQKSALAANYHNLSFFLSKLGQDAEALTYGRKAVALAKDALPENDSWRGKYEARLARLETEAKQPTAPAGTASAKSTTTSDDKAPPSIDKYADFRQGVIDLIESEKWRQVRQELTDSGPARELYAVGWFDGKSLRRLMHVDSIDDDNETLTFYYWSEGWLTSIVRIRKGSAVPFKGVAKATDIYNFLSEKLVSWKRIHDDQEEIEDPDAAGFAAAGQRMIVAGKAAEAIVLKAASTSTAKAAPATPAPTAGKTPPSLSDYDDFRQAVNDKIKSENWKETRLDLPGSGSGRRFYLLGNFQGKELRRLMHVDATGDDNGTFTFYYWSQGLLTSVGRIREGSAVKTKGVAKEIDTFNFFNEKFVSWVNKEDGKEMVLDPKNPDFPSIGQRILGEANAAKAQLLNATTKPTTTTVAATSTAPAPAKAPPSLEAFADFRKEVNDKAKTDEWKQVMKELGDNTGGRSSYVKGWFEGKELKKLVHVDTTDDKNGTYTFSFWLDGRLASIYRVREGSATKIDDVAKATDTYNFFGGKMVSWKRTQDDKEKVEDPAGPDFAATGQRVSDAADEAAAIVLKAAGAQ